MNHRLRRLHVKHLGAAECPAQAKNSRNVVVARLCGTAAGHARKITGHSTGNIASVV